MRATLTITRDDDGVVLRPPRGHAIDLMVDQSNDVSVTATAAVLLARNATSPPSRRNVVSFIAGDEAWLGHAWGADVHVDGRPVARGRHATLRDGSLIGWRGIELRFDVVKERPLQRLRRVNELLLFDCAGAAAPGRWPCLARAVETAGVKLARATAVAGAAPGEAAGQSAGAIPGAERQGFADAVRADADAPGAAEAQRFELEATLAGLGAPMPALHSRFQAEGLAWRRFDAVDGVSLVRVASRARGFEPSLALAVQAHVARWLARTRMTPLALQSSHLALTWDGDVVVWPPLSPQRSHTTGIELLAALYLLLFPELGDWWAKSDAVSMRANALWHSLVDPYAAAGAPGTPREPRPGDIVHVHAGADAFERALDELALPPASERRAWLASIVRGLFPEEWRRELEVREELATLDDAGLEELWRRA